MVVSAKSLSLGGDTRPTTALCWSLLRARKGAINNLGKDGRQL